MANLRQKKEKVLSTISAIRTLLDNYPVLAEAYGGRTDTSFTFMFKILRILGITQEQIVTKFASFISGKGGEGLLVGLENVVKAILAANIKNMFTCSINPLLPDDLMYLKYTRDGRVVGGEGIELDLNSIDIYGVLGNCPVEREGGIFYFDALESDYNLNDANSPDGGKYPYSGPYTISELWKSRDFNAFLWYVINKGQTSQGAEQKLYWDNRVSFLKEFSQDAELKEDFFGTVSDESKQKETSIPVAGSTISKKQFIRCEYHERPQNSIKRNVLRIYLNQKRYFKTRKVIYGRVGMVPVEFSVNKTIFEFNIDYIYSLKIFDAKTLVAAIMNAVMGIRQNINPSYSLRREVVAGQIRDTVRKMIAKDDNETDGSGRNQCYYTFSNEEYNRLLEEAVRKMNGTYESDGIVSEIDYDKLIDSVNTISEAATLSEQTQAIANVLMSAKDALVPVGGSGVPDIYYLSETDDLDVAGLGIVYRLIEETVTQIVMQVLTPKVAILFKINSYVMGNLDPEDDSWQLFMKNWENLVFSLVRDIKDRILNELYEWMIAEFTPLLELFVSKIMLETIRYYRELLTQLVDMCMTSGGFGNTNDGVLNVADYVPADIVPKKEGPVETC